MATPARFCRKCGRPLALRRRQKDGGQFYGCTSWPNCKYSESVAPWEANSADEQGAINETTMPARLAAMRTLQAAEPRSPAKRTAIALLVLLDYVVRWKHADDPEMWDAVDLMNDAMKADCYRAGNNEEDKDNDGSGNEVPGAG